MSRVIKIQTNFASGALDPLVRARIDLEQYYNGLETARNVFCLPQGGIKRRDGLKFVAQLPAAANPQLGVRAIPFEFSSNDSYMLVITQGRIHIFRNNALVTNINSTGNDFLAATAITGAMLSKIRYAQAADTMILVQEDLTPLKLVRGADHNLWTLSTVTFTNPPKNAFTVATSNPSADLTPSASIDSITVTASAGVFTSAHVDQFINVTSSFGRLRIVEFVSSTVVKAFAEVALFDTSVISASDWELETGHEDAWSVSRGFPVSITFHEGRLFFAGSKSLPTTFWGSTVNNFFDFELGEALDDQAIIGTITTESLNEITDIHSGRDLQIFTIAAEFFLPQLPQEPLTPTTTTVKVGTQNGSKPGVPVAGLDSGTLYIQRLGKMLNELVFTDAELSYTTSALSLLSGHLLDDPTDMAIRRATSTEEADRLFIVNSGDGSIACYSVLRSQQVVAPSQLATDGTFEAVAVDVDTVYTVVKRNVNSADVYYVEVFDSTLHTDSGKFSAAASSTASAAHLVGTTVDVVVDGAVQSQQTVAGGGTVTFERASLTSWEVGLPFTMEVKTMPCEPRLQSGNIRSFKKRILEVNAEVFQSQAMTINNQLVPFRSFGASILDAAVPPFTGIKKVGPLLGFNDEGAITVTQSAPLDLTVLALDYKLSVGN